MTSDIDTIANVQNLRWQLWHAADRACKNTSFYLDFLHAANRILSAAWEISREAWTELLDTSYKYENVIIEALKEKYTERSAYSKVRKVYIEAYQPWRKGK